MAVTAEVMDLTIACHSFPEMPEHEIHRDHILNAIEGIFAGGVQAVIVEGPEGVGKTTLLAQFSRRHYDSAISLFIRPANKFAYDPDTLRWDLCNQLEWYLNEKQIHDYAHADVNFLNMRLTQLSRRTKLMGQPVFFVIDGLDQIPDDSGDIQRLVMDMVPLHIPRCKFLFSRCSEAKELPINKGIITKPFPMTSFSYDDTRKYLSEIDTVDREFIDEVYRISRGLPEHLASIRRLLTSGMQLTMASLPKEVRHLYDLEWCSVDMSNDQVVRLLSILAHSRNEYTVDELAEILAISKATVTHLLEGISLLKFESGRQQKVRFVSEAVRRFAREQLRAYEEETNSDLIAYLMQNPASEAALTYLPGYLHEAERSVDLIQFLSPDTFAEMLGRNQSLTLVQQKTELGLLASFKEGKDGDLLRFALQRSSLSELAGMDIYDSEVKARLALGETESALALAQSALLKENRLHLLALIARKHLEKGISVSDELNDQIRQLYQQIDPRTLGKTAMKIARNLIHSNPDLGLELVEQAAAVDDTSSEHPVDWALASLSASVRRDTDSETFEEIRLRIQDSDALRISTEASLLLGDNSPRQVIAKLDAIGKASDKIYLLRQWVQNNRSKPNAVDVVQYALDLIITEASYTPNATVLQELATALPYASDEHSVRKLVGMFTSQMGSIEQLGPTEDLVRLQLLLAEAEWSYDLEAGTNRVFDVYLTVVELEDLQIRCACLATMVEFLARVDKDGILEDRDKLHSSTERDLETSLTCLLAATADHFHAVKPIIRALAATRPQRTLEICLSLNTQYRRNAALLEVVRTALDVPVGSVNLRFIGNVIDRFDDYLARDIALVETIERLARAHTIPDSLLPELPSLVGQLESIHDASERCRICSLAYVILSDIDPQRYSPLTQHLLGIFNQAWNAMDIGWSKVDTGFKVTEALAQRTPEKAREYLAETEQIRRGLLVDDHATAEACVSNLQLAIRAFGGLLPRNLDTDEDLKRITYLLNRIPSSGIRAQAWAELAMRYYLSGRSCETIVTKHVKPLLADINDGDGEYLTLVTVAVAPALYCAHRPTALDAILQLPTTHRDEALNRVCNFILRKLPSWDPYEEHLGQGYDISYEDGLDICDLIGLMDSDALIAHHIRNVADSVVRGKRERFTRQQIERLAETLSQLIETRLPNCRNIKHDGYKIVCKAQVARMKQDKGPVWDDLVDQSRAIPNCADRTYTLALVASAMPSRESARRQEVLREAVQLVEDIPASFDRVERYHTLADVSYGVDTTICRDCLQKAMSTSVTSSDPDTYPIQRAIVDLAYRISPELASSLAALVDDDPARRAIREKLKQEVEVLELKKRMVDQVSGGDLPNPPANKDSIQAALRCWAGLNARRISHVNMDQMRPYIKAAAGLSVSEGFPLYAWVLENAIRRYSQTDQARTLLRPLFEATLMSAQLASKTAGRTLDQFERTKLQTTGSGVPNGEIFGPGDREKVQQFLTRWFEDRLDGYLKICDKYFGPEDLPLLQLVQSVAPACKVKILTSKEWLEKQKVPAPWDEAFANFWRQSVSDQDPPYTEIVVVGTKTGDFPIHDRWWVTRNSGLCVGTSYNSLGLNARSGITIMTAAEAARYEQEIDRYLERTEVEHKGLRLHYSLFTL